MSEPAVVVQDLSKRFRLQKERPASLKEKITTLRFGRRQEFWALKDVTFSVPKGSMFGLIGHNGSGKSTLLRMIAGIYQPTSGRLTINGKVSALLELGAGFHPDLTGRENVYLNAAILGMTRRETDRLFGRIVDFSGLHDFIDTPVRHYSSGMYVRLGFAVAVHVDPEILVIDEVIAVGDEEFQRRCMEHLYTIRRHGSTVIIVTHSLDTVKNLCDEAVWLDHGRVRSIGPGAEVATAYVNEVNLAEASRRAGGLEVDTRPLAGAAALESLEVLGGGGQPATVVTPLEPVTLRFTYRVEHLATPARVLFTVSTENGTVVGGPTLPECPVIPAEPGRGVLDFVIPALPLGPGDYCVTATLYDELGFVQHDAKTFDSRLRVRPGGTEVRGLVRINGAWAEPRHARTAESPVTSG